MARFLLLLSLLALSADAAEPIVVNSGERRTAVVELYTSEGCSSCPPADRWLSRLVETSGAEMQVLALSFHVDYWNYLGWRDRFSSADYTSRQRQLGANNRQQTIYTPEFFVDGREARGSDNILDKIQQANAEQPPLPLQLRVSRDAQGLLLEVATDGPFDGPLHHRYMVFENELSSLVLRGENAGSKLSHQRVVRYMSPALVLREQNRHRIDIDPDWNAGNVGVAVLVTSPGSLRYLDALQTSIAPLLGGRKR